MSTVSSSRTSKAQAVSEKVTPAFLPLSGWWVAFFIFLMFTGMMHDFDAAGISELDSHNRNLDSVSKFEQNVNEAKIERKLSFVLAVLIALYCFVSATKELEWESLSILLLVMLGLGWICLSFTWSLNPGLTARSLVRVGVYVFLAYSISLRFKVDEFCKILLVASILSIILSILFEALVGAPGSDDGKYRLSGSLHSNLLARFAMIVAIISASLAKKEVVHRRNWIILLALALIIVQLTRSRTGLAATIAGLATVFVIGQSLGTMSFTVVVGLFFAGLMGIFLAVLGDSGFAALGDAAAMGRAEDVSSLTGRLPLWEILLDRANDFPWTGAGYGAFWNNEIILSIFERKGWFVAHSHNAYIEVYLNTGLVGFSILCLLGLVATRRSLILAYRTNQFSYVAISAILVAVFVNGLAESGFVLPRELAILPLMLCFLIAQGVDSCEPSE